MGTFVYLEYLSFRLNYLVSTIPASIGSLPRLLVLDVLGNQLTGSIPASIGNLTQLRILTLERNRLQGHLPPSLGKLTHLETIALGNNHLTGTFPSALSGMQSLQHLLIPFNRISGSLPSSFSALTAMATFNVWNNSLDGPVPDFLCVMPALVSITLGYNFFSSSLPACLSTLPVLQYVNLFHNQITGTLPASYASMPQLTILYLNHNNMHGSLDVLCEVRSVEQIYVEINSFSGTVPTCFTSLAGLDSAFLGTNYFTGPIPVDWSDIQHLKFVDLSHNLVTGALPPRLSNITNLQFLYLNDNFLTGTVPTSYAQLPMLTLLLLQYNQLTGPIHSIFNVSTQKVLDTVQLSGNSFTGTLPGAALFSATSTLTSFSAVDNCLSGTIPVLICDCRSLKLLALDGAGSGQACHSDIMPGLTSSYLVTDPITGGVPTCLFALPNLTTLHLSGNSLSGNLGSYHDLVLGDKLIDLALSHNVLTGRIPRAIQQRVFYSLDLSYNRLSGTLESDFNTQPVHFQPDTTTIGISRRDVHYTYNSSNTYLSLENNRLSGDLPATVFALTDLSILNGNLFSCDWEQTQLPEHDSARDSYQCGSAAFDSQLYAWLIFLVCSVLFVALLHRYRAHVAAYFDVQEAVHWCRIWLTVLDEPSLQGKLRNYRYVCQVAHIIGRVSVWCTALIVVILVPLYAACTHYYGTITFQYAWSVSAAFLSGPVPFSLTLVAVVGIIYACLYQLRRYKHIYLRISDEAEEQQDEREIACPRPSAIVASNAQIYSAYATFFAMNFALVLGVNIAFVYIALYESNTALVLAQLGLSLFKDGWNSVGSIRLMRWAFHAVATNDTSRADFINTQLFVALFNNIAIPCLVVIFVSPSCSYNVLVAPPTVTFLYLYLQCAIFVNETCFFYYPSVASSTYSPPFTYSYQCAAQFLTSYAPTFVYLAIEVAFVTPALLVLLIRLHKRATPGTLWYRLLHYLLEHNLKLPNLAATAAQSSEPLKRSVYQPLFDANQMLVTLLTYLGILLTFGVVFPPLAVVMLVAILSLILVDRLAMGRFLASVLEQQRQLSAPGEVAASEVSPADSGSATDKQSGCCDVGSRYIDVIELDSQGVGCLHLDKLRIALWMVTCYCFAFYALFFFDTLGDEQGTARAYWVLIAVPLIPVGIFVGDLARRAGARRRLWRWFWHSHINSSSSSSSTAQRQGDPGNAPMEVELGEVIVRTVNPLTTAAAATAGEAQARIGAEN